MVVAAEPPALSARPRLRYRRHRRCSPARPPAPDRGARRRPSPSLLARPLRRSINNLGFSFKGINPRAIHQKRKLSVQKCPNLQSHRQIKLVRRRRPCTSTSTSSSSSPPRPIVRAKFRPTMGDVMRHPRLLNRETSKLVTMTLDEASSSLSPSPSLSTRCSAVLDDNERRRQRKNNVLDAINSKSRAIYANIQTRCFCEATYPISRGNLIFLLWGFDNDNDDFKAQTSKLTSKPQYFSI